MLPPKRTLPCVLARAQHDSTGILTILREHTPEPDPQALALGALGWVLADDDHAERLLALTGLAPDDLRARLGEAGVQVAVLDFLAAHERDLIACAHALGVEPPALILARARLSGEMFEP